MNRARPAFPTSMSAATEADSHVWSWRSGCGRRSAAQTDTGIARACRTECRRNLTAAPRPGRAPAGGRAGGEPPASHGVRPTLSLTDLTLTFSELPRFRSSESEARGPGPAAVGAAASVSSHRHCAPARRTRDRRPASG